MNQTVQVLPRVLTQHLDGLMHMESPVLPMLQRNTALVLVDMVLDGNGSGETSTITPTRALLVQQLAVFVEAVN